MSLLDIKDAVEALQYIINISTAELSDGLGHCISLNFSQETDKHINFSYLCYENQLQNVNQMSVS